MNKDKFSFSTLLSILSTETGSLVAVNFCFILTAIPLFTFGGSLIAMQKILIELSKGNKVRVFRTYFKLFKENFVSGLKLTLFLALFSALFFFSIRFYIINSNINEIYLPITILLFGLFFLFMGISSLLILMFSHVDLTFWQSIKNSFILYFGYLGKLFLIELATFSVILISFFLFPYSLPIILTFTFSVAMLISTIFSFYILEEHVINK